MRIVRTAAPAHRPLSIDDARAYLRVDHYDEDASIDAMLDAAVSRLDGWSGILGRCMITQTWRVDLSRFPAGDVRLPFPDIQSATVEYTDVAGSGQTFTAWNLGHDARGGYLRLQDGAEWPETSERPDAVRVTIVAGYGGADAVPAAIKLAIKMDIGAMHKTRDGSAANTMAYDALISPFRHRVV